MKRPALLFVFLLACCPPVFAGDDYVFDLEISGEDGGAGDAGAPGNPAGDGQAGGDGESLAPGLISAQVEPDDPFFDALVTAGGGGDGGNGGGADPADGAPGDGGDGGEGGGLALQFEFVQSGTLVGLATLGGFSGHGGNGGDAGAAAGLPGDGGDGGHGGDIDATGLGATQFEDPSGFKHLLTAGNGGDGGHATGAGTGGFGGRGGSITVDSQLANTGLGEVVNGLTLTAGNGGDGAAGGSGGDGGSVRVSRAVTASGLESPGGPAGAAARGSLQEVSIIAAGGNGGDAVDGQAGHGGQVEVATLDAQTGPSFIADALVNLSGGHGGDAHDSGRAGDGGSVELGQARVSADGVNDAHLDLELTAGHGGNGFGDAAAGNGGSVLIDGAATILAGNFAVLFQQARGGNAGAVEDGQAGVAGNATSAAALAGHSEQLLGSAYSIGGNGGDRYSAGGYAGDGGHAAARLEIVNTGPIAGTDAQAHGGNGGSGHLGAVGGVGGGALALAESEAALRASAFAIALGGSGAVAGGHAQAEATARGPMRSWADVMAGTANERGEGVSAAAVYQTATEASAVASASFVESPGSISATQSRAWTRATVLPDVAGVTAMIQSNPGVAINFDLAGGSDLLGYASIGAGFQIGAALDAYVHTASFAVDVASLPTSQNLLVGLLDATASGDDFGGFLMTVVVDSVVLLSLQGDEAADVADVLDDVTYDLGSLAALAGADGLLALEIALVLEDTAAGSGIAFDLVFGNSTLGSGASVPLPGAIWLMLSAMLFVAIRKRTGNG